MTSTVRIPRDSGWVGESGCFALVSFSVAVSAGDGLVLRRHSLSVMSGIESGAKTCPVVLAVGPLYRRSSCGARGVLPTAACKIAAACRVHGPCSLDVAKGSGSTQAGSYPARV